MDASESIKKQFALLAKLKVRLDIQALEPRSLSDVLLIPLIFLWVQSLDISRERTKELTIHPIMNSVLVPTSKCTFNPSLYCFDAKLSFNWLFPVVLENLM